jgi:hypothetical protein
MRLFFDHFLLADNTATPSIVQPQFAAVVLQCEQLFQLPLQ